MIEQVTDRESFLQFVHALAADREAFEGTATSVDGFQGPWANTSIASFLEAAAAWAEDSAFGARIDPQPLNEWQAFAMFLWAGRSYE
ncbi:hypothetical protein ACFOED_01635 [Vulcaniibacterium thermophilum]|nr:hypothetical protein [Vulcaniibacterium thermophilum]